MQWEHRLMQATPWGSALVLIWSPFRHPSATISSICTPFPLSFPAHRPPSQHSVYDPSSLRLAHSPFKVRFVSATPLLVNHHFLRFSHGHSAANVYPLGFQPSHTTLVFTQKCRPSESFFTITVACISWTFSSPRVLFSKKSEES